MTDNSFIARCLCGGVTWTARGEPIGVRRCFCRDCQRLGAGDSTVNAIFPVEAVEISGELKAYESMADSGNRMTRKFCPTCGTQITSASSSRPHLVVLRVGAMEDPARAAPQMNIWVKSAPPWAQIDADLPRTEGQPPPLPTPAE